jgi:pilus assembly protein FimV
VQKDLMLALESSAAQRKENEELQKRIKGLEDQLNDMQRLLTLKDADLAALQKQLREQGQAVSLPSEKAGQEEAQPAGETETPATTETPVTGEEKPVEMAGEEKPATEAMTTEEQATEEQPATEMQPGEEPAAETETTKPEPVAKPEPKKPAVKKAAPAPVVEEPSVVGLLMENLNTVLMAGGGILVLLLLLWLKRRRSGGFQESILSGGTSSMLNAKEEELEGETSFLSDLAISGMGGGTIQSDEGEVDPITEADVFMAYGRNQQAEEVLKKALDKDPERPDLNAKLLEVYYNLKDSDKFLALVTGAAAASLKDNSELWGKVAAMGHELAPDNDLFGDAAGTEVSAVAPSGAPESASEEVLDIGLNLDELSTEMESEGASEGDLSIDLGLDFGDLEEEVQPVSEETAEQPAQIEETMDFDLDLGGVEEVSEAPEEESEIGFDLDLGAEPAAEETSVLDFDLGTLGAEEEPPAEEIALDLDTEGGDEEISMDFDLGVSEEQAPTDEDELDLGDLGDIDFGDLGLETSEEEEQPVSLESEELDLSSLESTSDDLGDLDDFGDLDEEGLLGDSDEIATKLDLAQAYIEMGDNEGARTMLEEVVEGGNDEQKQQAQELISKI